jgi:hypothetical protein
VFPRQNYVCIPCVLHTCPTLAASCSSLGEVLHFMELLKLLSYLNSMTFRQRVSVFRQMQFQCKTPRFAPIQNEMQNYRLNIFWPAVLWNVKHDDRHIQNLLVSWFPHQQNQSRMSRRKYPTTRNINSVIRMRLFQKVKFRSLAVSKVSHPQAAKSATRYLHVLQFPAKH